MVDYFRCNATVQLGGNKYRKLVVMLAGSTAIDMI